MFCFGQRNIAIEDTKWGIFIDTNYDQNWFLKNYENNQKYASKIIFSIWALFTVPALMLAFINSPLLYVVWSIQYFLPPLTLAVLLCKIPKYDDVFYIKSEIKLIILACLGFTILYVPFMVLPTIGNQFIDELVLISVSIIGPFCILYSHLYLPFKKFNLPKTIWGFNAYLQTINLENTAGYSQSTELSNNISISTSQKVTDLTLNQCLRNEDGFLVFTRHINKEFAIENILFLVEVYQLKCRIAELLGDDVINADDANDIFSNITFPESIPQSTIIAKLDKTEMIHKCAAQLFIKYICDQGYFAINICGASRSVSYDYFNFSGVTDVAILAGNLAKNVTSYNDIYHLFDEQLREIYKLLTGSFSRFKRSNEYERLLNLSIDIISDNFNETSQ